MKKQKKSRLKVGISIGDLNGIGLEIILKTLADNRINELCTPIIFSSKHSIIQGLKLYNISGLNFESISKIDEVKGHKTFVLNCWTNKVDIEAGKVDKVKGEFAALSLEKAVLALKDDSIDALVTAPINKDTIQSETFQFPGHTEYLQSIDEAEDSLMLMVSEQTKIGVATGHIPLSEVPKSLTSELILKKLTLLNRSLKEDFLIEKPKIAIMGLNPHAGDNGLIGKEEIEIIEPAIQQAKSIGILPFGPYAADGFFGSGKYKEFDGILAMYHDQGLIPAKSFAFGSGTNFTAGLSFVRTSPDHGTAYEIAGKNLANEASFRQALYRAIEIAENRRMKKEWEENKLLVNKNR